MVSEGNGPPCGEEATGLSLSVNPTQPPTPLSPDQTEQQIKGIVEQQDYCRALVTNSATL